MGIDNFARLLRQLAKAVGIEPAEQGLEGTFAMRPEYRRTRLT
jgi:hypothetical protein